MTTTEADQPSPAARTAYLVLGMHRSGTSAVTQLLGLAGAKLPANVMPGDEHNEKGYFEPWKIAIFNDERLRAAGSAWDDIFAYPFRTLEPPLERAWLDQAVALFKAEYRGVATPLMKDPRATVLMPFWAQALDEAGVGVRVVVAVRHPLAAAGSLKRRDGFHEAKSVLIWSAYMLAAEAYTRAIPRAFIGYDALLADWRTEVARIEAAHGAPLPKLTEAAGRKIDQFLSPDLRHNAGQGDLAAPGWPGEVAAQVLGWFEAAARGESPDRAPLEAAAAELARRQADFGVLVSPVARDHDLARSQLTLRTAEVDVERRTREHDRQVLEAGWRADIQQWERDYIALATRVSAQLDEALSDD